MTPKRIGFVGFDCITGLHLVGPADVFVAAALEDGNSGRSVKPTPELKLGLRCILSRIRAEFWSYALALSATVVRCVVTVVTTLLETDGVSAEHDSNSRLKVLP